MNILESVSQCILDAWFFLLVQWFPDFCLYGRLPDRFSPDNLNFKVTCINQHIHKHLFKTSTENKIKKIFFFKLFHYIFRHNNSINFSFILRNKYSTHSLCRPPFHCGILIKSGKHVSDPRRHPKFVDFHLVSLSFLFLCDWRKANFL